MVLLASHTHAQETAAQIIFLQKGRTAAEMVSGGGGGGSRLSRNSVRSRKEQGKISSYQDCVVGVRKLEELDRLFYFSASYSIASGLFRCPSILPSFLFLLCCCHSAALISKPTSAAHRFLSHLEMPSLSSYPIHSSVLTSSAASITTVLISMPITQLLLFRPHPHPYNRLFTV